MALHSALKDLLTRLKAAAAAIRKSKHPAATDIAIVAMTADAFEEDVQRAFVCGMNAHVAKPLELKRFIDTVESLNICKKEDLTDKR
jgi:CheY-like chemotaxis protein